MTAIKAEIVMHPKNPMIPIYKIMNDIEEQSILSSLLINYAIPNLNAIICGVDLFL